MKLIVGLGNPGAEYEQTRHNCGFLAIDARAQELKIEWKVWGKLTQSQLIQVSDAAEKYFLLKPLTYMNLSGRAVVEVAHFFKILPEDICVIHDDLDLNSGDVRLKVGGGDGGHNGLKSITQSLSTNGFSRIRMGIGRPTGKHISHDYVLDRFSKNEAELLSGMIDRTHLAMAAFLAGPDQYLRLMNEMNRRKSKEVI